MSLHAIFDKEKTKSIKEMMPDILITYKGSLIVYESDFGLLQPRPKYIAPYTRFEYLVGEQFMRTNLGLFPTPVVDSPEDQLSYYPGFHSFVKKTSAEKYNEKLSTNTIGVAVLLTCGVRKEWITAIGLEGDRDIVVVSNRIVIPYYPQTDIRYDKNCNWFFEAQSQTKSVDTNGKNAVSGVRTEEEYATTNGPHKKYKDLRREFRKSTDIRNMIR
jgi:hypothetical protein